MATKEQTLVKIGELLEEHRAACLESAEKLLRSGAIDCTCWRNALKRELLVRR